METGAAEQLIGDLYKYALGRNASPEELGDWVGVLVDAIA